MKKRRIYNMKIVFMGTPDFAVPNLEILYENIDFDIELVISQGDKKRGRGKKLQFPPVKEKALDLGLDVYQPEDVNSEESIEKIRKIAPDFIIVVAFGQILKKEILSIPKYGCINVHASLLPKYRGAAPINWAIIDGEKETGITIMHMNEGLDTGDILGKKSIEISKDDDYPSLHDKLASIGGELLINTLEDIVNGDVNRLVQDDNLSNYAPMIFKKTGKINWDNYANDIVNKVRGLKPWPTAYTNYEDMIMKIHKAKVLDENSHGEIGEIIKVCNDGVYVSTKDKIIVIEELQFPNKKKMNVRDYIRGNEIKTGVILGN
jgi:methionyl-tRNA formyltransferase